MEAAIALENGMKKELKQEQRNPATWRGYQLSNGLTITQGNYHGVSAHLGVPRSLLFALGTDTKWFTRLEDMADDMVAFYDIETDDRCNFLFGYIITLRQVNMTSKREHLYHRYDSPEAMAEALMQYNIVIGFNNYRFDNEILAKKASAYFETLDLPRFTLRIPKLTLCLDALLFYALWKPWNPNHKMESLFREFDMEQPSLEDKDERCKAELQVLGLFYPKIAQIYKFYVNNFMIDPYTLFSLPMNGLAKLRRWCYQSYILQSGGYPELMKIGCQEKADFYRHFKKGFYRNVHRWDCKSAYPTVAASMKIGLYCSDDFSDYMKWLIEQRKENPEIALNLKWLANSWIGDMGAKTSDLANASIMFAIWDGHKRWMELKVRHVGKKNIIYSYTDNFYSQKQLDFGDVNPYELHQEQDFQWLAIYNQQRLLGLQMDGTLFKRHFDREMKQLAMWREIDKRLENLLKAMPEDVLENPLKAFNGWRISDLPLDMLKITIYKNSEECRDVNYWMIWDQLNMGFNECWLAKGNKIIAEPNLNKIDFKRYEKMARKYIALYRLGSITQKPKKAR